MLGDNAAEARGNVTCVNVHRTPDKEILPSANRGMIISRDEWWEWGV